MSSRSVIRVAERDPTGQYVRYDAMLGQGLWKRVYKGFDEVNGMEIAWSVVVLSDRIVNSVPNLWHLIVEANLMKLLDHKNIVKCHHFWIDYSKRNLHMITEIFSSETLLHYIVRHVPVDDTSTKNWCRQILQGLDYLHTRDPPIAHRDVKLLNIFVDGNTGIVKLGDFGFARFIEPGTSLNNCVGSPMYMAPEIFQGNYNHMVDIHAFGICVLWMVTREKPYSEFINNDEFYRKIKEGVKPVLLNNVTDPQIKHFLDRCFAPASTRSPAIDLLNDPFLTQIESSPSQVESSLSQVTRGQVDRLLHVVKEIGHGNKIFRLQGSMKWNVSGVVAMSLSIICNNNKKKKNVEGINFEFPVEVETDRIHQKINQFLMDNIATQLKLSKEDVIVATEIIKQLITEILPQPIKEKPTNEILSEQTGDESGSEAENNGMLSCLGKLLSSVCSNPQI
ncbi:serine/threonine-protein kinase WNK8-like [Spinacia oleracea]|uniref:non-specific serine/threonine protein kinase n=1 Tax=Spinacia oleracea TaxID=3562 RepID=A0ABM3R6R4_SPIOL|nr:serine/threonine-protein kinase WNK8-like [Spinacia oleracea]